MGLSINALTIREEVRMLRPRVHQEGPRRARGAEGPRSNGWRIDHFQGSGFVDCPRREVSGAPPGRRAGRVIDRGHGQQGGRQMEARLVPVLPVRAWEALRERGPRYFGHKVLRRTTGRWPWLKRRLVYRSPRAYWTLRGGRDYFLEQEGQAARTRRSQWLADRIARYRPESILEVGCGYGKQLRALRERVDAPLVGLDFSATQLGMARRYLEGVEGVAFVLGSGDRLPFPDKAFDLVFTSAVILHNPTDIADRMRREVVRVARRWIVHNEDRNVSYNRFGHDTVAWYRAEGIPLAESGTIPGIPDEADSQFCVAEPWRC